MKNVLDFKLKNGLRTIALKKQGAGICVLSLIIRAGSRFETKKTNGTSHLVEHLLSRKISDHFGGSSWVKDYLSNGLIGSTHNDRTEFSLTVAKEDLERSLEFFAIVLEKLEINDHILDAEKNIIKEEILESRREDEDYGKVIQALYGENPLSLRAIGSRGVISKLKKEQLEKFHKKYYRPENCILTIVGDFDATNLKNKTKTTLDKYQMGETQFSLPFFVYPGDKFIALKSNDDQNYFGFFSPAELSNYKDYIKRKFFIEILNQYLFHNIRNKGFSYTLDCKIQAYVDYADMSIETYFEPRKTLNFYSELRKSLNDFIKSLTEEDLNLLIANKTKELKIENNYLENQANNLSWFAFNFGQPITIEEEIVIIKTISHKEIQSFFEKTFGEHRGTIIFSGKIDKELKKKLKSLWTNGFI